MEKRERRNAYEGSKLLDAAKGQKSYEELFLEVNPLQLASANKGKSKVRSLLVHFLLKGEGVRSLWDFRISISSLSMFLLARYESYRMLLSL